MNQRGPDQNTLRAAAQDARRAEVELDNAHAWLETALQGPMDPLGAEAWVFDETFQHVLLVKHRQRGWVPPGGRVEPGESPREAARRELLEETGISVDLLDAPAAVTVRSYHPDLSLTLGLSYGAVVHRPVRLVEESGQPVAWVPLTEDWEGAFPQDRPHIRAYARRLSHRAE
ncbi:NUDIX hydrolase [Nonomuraea sp. PA05]|uniref:NUDIX domain-containing protein n=1 Tax=Nonomuraea sp. PA05 TaxID=2604466 RepID=UPI0011D90391|nr:NUDIX hydrolase [Nonomuraea sp. PA05]TYB66166.1 NUDIX hydrolase [Nonomuraea sp. PA05]